MSFQWTGSWVQRVPYIGKYEMKLKVSEAKQSEKNGNFISHFLDAKKSDTSRSKYFIEQAKRMQNESLFTSKRNFFYAKLAHPS
jgi:hypothetical protein